MIKQETIRLLLLHGADPNINGEELLHAAAIKGNVDGLKLILNHPGFDHSLINHVDKYGNHHLHTACEFNQPAVVQLILESPHFDHSLVNTPDSDGQTPLQLTSNPAIVTLLVQHGATPVEQAVAILSNGEDQPGESANTECDSEVVEMEARDMQEQLPQNTTAIPLANSGMSLSIGVLPPASH